VINLLSVNSQQDIPPRDLSHVGGINEGLGGVDPFADENMFRLFGLI